MRSILIRKEATQEQQQSKKVEREVFLLLSSATPKLDDDNDGKVLEGGTEKSAVLGLLWSSTLRYQRWI